MKVRKAHINYVPVSSYDDFIQTFATCLCFLLADEQTREQTKMALIEEEWYIHGTAYNSG